MSVIEAAPIVDSRIGEPMFEGDVDKQAHIVYPKDRITEAMVMGSPVQALCGYTWVPDRNPDRHGVCPECVDTFESVLGRPWPGRR